MLNYQSNMVFTFHGFLALELKGLKKITCLTKSASQNCYLLCCSLFAWRWVVNGEELEPAGPAKG